jgi:hypothetical protein
MLEHHGLWNTAWWSNRVLRGQQLASMGACPSPREWLIILDAGLPTVGVACRRRDGQFDSARLGPGEFIVEPGLAYRLESAKRASREAAANRSSLTLPPQSPAEAVDVPAEPGEPNRVVGEIAGALAFYLTCALAIQLVLHVFGAG